MRKLIRFCSMAMIFGAGSLFANSHPGPGEWELNAQFLLLKPSFDDTYFVISTPAGGSTPVNGERYHNNFNFEPGFRVGGRYAFCDCPRELLVSYTYLQDNHTKTVRGDHLWATIGHPDFASSFDNSTGSASSKLNFLYQRLDALYAQEIYNCCGLDVYVQAGLEAAYVRLQENYTYVNTTTLNTGNISKRSRTSGVGPQLGLSLDYDLWETSCGNWGFTFVGSGSLLAADSFNREDNSVVDGSVTTNVFGSRDRKSDWRVVPALHLRAGINYEMCLSCFNIDFEVGYEFSSYVKALSKTRFYDDVADGLSSNHFYNFDVQGLYVSGSVSF